MADSMSDCDRSTCSTTRARLKALLDGGMTTRQVGSLYGVSSAMVWRVANTNYEPKNEEIRKKLGFPIICPRCGMEIEQ